MRRVGIFVPYLRNPQIHESVFTTASLGAHFNGSQAWFIITESCSNVKMKIEENLVTYDINIDADITVAMKVPENDSLLLFDVYKVYHAAGSPLLITHKGYWSSLQGFHLLEPFQLSWVSRRRNFGNITLKASTALLEKPNNLTNMDYLTDNKHNLQLDPMQRKTYQLLKPMQSLYNVSFDILFTDSWGLQQPNGTWSGILGQLLNYNADFSICPLRFTLDRILAIQFTPELHTQLIHFLLRHPHRNDIRNIFFEPLSASVWWCVLILIIIAIMMLMLHMKYERCSRQLMKPVTERRRFIKEAPWDRRFDFIWLTVFEAIFMQGPATDIFRLLSTRWLIFVTCLFSFMLLQFYGGFIVGSLLANTPRSIVNLKALYMSNMEIGMENIQYNYIIFTNTTNLLVKDIYTKRICHKKPANIMDIKTGALRIKAGGFAFHAAIDRLYGILKDILTESEFCDLQEIMFNPAYTSSAGLRKSSPFREHFAHIILHLRATGLMQYNDKIWNQPKLDCSRIKDHEVDVDLAHFAPALLMLAVAMLCSAIVLCMELFIAFCWQQRKQIFKKLG